MIDRVLSFGFAVLGACCALANEMVPVEGTVAETSVVSVPLSPWLATQVTRGRPDALAAELRVMDGKGADVPYVLRPMRARVEKYERCWHDLTVTKVTEFDGRLEVEATVPAGLEKAQLVALDVQTPREDFEQVVTVRSDRGLTAEGVICDYARFANFRKTEVPLEMHGAARLTIVFARPSDTVDANRFERVIVENAQGEVETKTIRQSVSTRPFRIDRLRLAESVCKTSFTPAPPWEVHWAAEVEHEAKAKLTTLTFNAYGLPVTAVGVRTSDSNFSRSVRLLARRNNGWHPLAEGRISAFDLPGKQARNLEIPLRSEAAEDTLRLEIRDGDNPLLNFEHLQVTAKVTAYEIVFVAKPGEKYALEVRHGAARPCYDSIVGDYIANVQDPVRWDVKTTDAWGDADGPTAVWLVWNPIPCVTAVVFVLLLGVCFWLFRTVKQENA